MVFLAGTAAVFSGVLHVAEWKVRLRDLARAEKATNTRIFCAYFDPSTELQQSPHSTRVFLSPQRPRDINPHMDYGILTALTNEIPRYRSHITLKLDNCILPHFEATSLGDPALPGLGRPLIHETCSKWTRALVSTSTYFAQISSAGRLSARAILKSSAKDVQIWSCARCPTDRQERFHGDGHSFCGA